MRDTIRCPDCGHENPPGYEECAACGFPLTETRPPADGEAGETPLLAPDPPAGADDQTAGATSPVPGIPRLTRPLPRRPRRGNQMSATLWLVFGTFSALVVVWVAIKANVDRMTQPVEGASPVQQASADSIIREVERDSTNVAARINLGDLLFDTGNWSHAIVQYRAAVRMDSSLTPSIVDLGVCYYNLGDARAAERHFQLALARDPRHPIALFNLGIVHEARKQHREALEYFHRALDTEPREDMKQSIVEAVDRVQKAMAN